MWPQTLFLEGRADSLEKTMMLGKIEGRRRGRQRMRWLDGITDSTDYMRDSDRQGSLRAATYGVIKSWTQLSNRTTALWNSGRARETEALFSTNKTQGAQRGFCTWEGPAVSCLVSVPPFWILLHPEGKRNRTRKGIKL